MGHQVTGAMDEAVLRYIKKYIYLRSPVEGQVCVTKHKIPQLPFLSEVCLMSAKICISLSVYGGKMFKHIKFLCYKN